MLREIELKGRLAKKFGESFKMDVDTVAEAVRALGSQFPEFRQEIMKGSYRVSMGIVSVSEDLLTFKAPGKITIEPVVAGSKSAITQIIIGVAIAAVAWWAAPAVVGAAGPTLGMGTAIAGGVTYGTVATFGIAMALSGVATLLSPTPKTDFSANEKPDERASFLLTGPRNSAEQGAAIPLVYGTSIRTGSVIVSAGIKTEEVLS